MNDRHGAAAAAGTDGAETEKARPAMRRMRVLKRGCGKISTGAHVRGEGDVRMTYRDVFDAPLAVAEGLEDAGLAAKV